MAAAGVRADVPAKDTKGAFDTRGVVCQTYVGGQALIEGVMMRGRRTWAVSVREPDGGIYTESHELTSGRDRNRWMRVPVIRGVTAFVESLVLGYKALQISAEHAYDLSDEDDGDSSGDAGTKGPGDANGGGKKRAAGISIALHALALPLKAALSLEPDSDSAADSDAAAAPADASTPTAVSADSADAKEASSQADDASELPAGLMTVSMVIGVVMGVVLFVVAPALITNLVVGDYLRGALVWNLVDGVVRVGVFLAYLALIALMPDIKRMFCYHGAEHKTIHCYEHGMPLTPANAMRFPRLHVRCGTAFLLMTMIIAIFVFTVVPVDRLIAAMGIESAAARLAVVICSRIVLLPVVAGLAYEVTVKWAGAHPEKLAVRVVLWPGLQLQRLTTNPPDESMLECAISSMRIVLHAEGLPETPAAGEPQPQAQAA